MSESESGVVGPSNARLVQQAKPANLWIADPALRLAAKQNSNATNWVVVGFAAASAVTFMIGNTTVTVIAIKSGDDVKQMVALLKSVLSYGMAPHGFLGVRVLSTIDFLADIAE